MRRHVGTDDIDLLNEDEIEAALNAAIDRPLGDLLSIEEFAEKFAPVAETPAADAAELEASEATDEELESDEQEWQSDDVATLPLPFAADDSDDALRRAA